MNSSPDIDEQIIPARKGLQEDADVTTSHSTKPASGQVAGYPANGCAAVTCRNLHQQRWQDLLHLNRDMVAQSNPLQVSGRLTKVTGLVMEAVGLRMAVGSTCWIELPNNRIEAEVVGFAGDKLFLMPENDVQGLVPGARVIPCRTVARARSPSDNVNRRAAAPPTWHAICRSANICWDACSTAPAVRSTNSALAGKQERAAAEPPDQPAGTRSHQRCAGCRRARHQQPAHRRPRPAHGPVLRLRRRQERAARHDGALHQRRRDRGRPDRRTRPRSEGIHRPTSSARKAWRARWWSPPRPTPAR